MSFPWRPVGTASYLICILLQCQFHCSCSYLAFVFAFGHNHRFIENIYDHTRCLVKFIKSWGLRYKIQDWKKDLWTNLWKTRCGCSRAEACRRELKIPTWSNQDRDEGEWKQRSTFETICDRGIWDRGRQGNLRQGNLRQGDLHLGQLPGRCWNCLPDTELWSRKHLDLKILLGKASKTNGKKAVRLTAWVDPPPPKWSGKCEKIWLWFSTLDSDYIWLKTNFSKKKNFDHWPPPWHSLESHHWCRHPCPPPPRPRHWKCIKNAFFSLFTMK